MCGVIMMFVIMQVNGCVCRQCAASSQRLYRACSATGRRVCNCAQHWYYQQVDNPLRPLQRCENVLQGECHLLVSLARVTHSFCSQSLNESGKSMMLCVSCKIAETRRMRELGVTPKESFFARFRRRLKQPQQTSSQVCVSTTTSC